MVQQLISWPSLSSATYLILCGIKYQSKFHFQLISLQQKVSNFYIINIEQSLWVYELWVETFMGLRVIELRGWSGFFNFREKALN